MIDIGSRMWAVEPVFARAIQMYLSKYGSGALASEILQAQNERKNPWFVGFDNKHLAGLDGFANMAAADGSNSKSKSDKYVAVVPIMGVMTRYGDACSYGTETIGAWIRSAYQDDRVAAIMLEQESGGGDVNGTEQLGDVISERNKPVGSFVKGRSASANYWISALSDFVMMESGTVSEVGSIGVFMAHGEVKTFEEKTGEKWTMIRAEGSEEKALMNPWEALNEEIVADARARMKPMRDRFIEKVKAGRGEKLDLTSENEKRIFGGRMFSAKEAIKLGLADKVGTMQDAAKLLLKMA